MHECLLCERDMKKAKTIFGSGCILGIYSLLKLDTPKNSKTREQYLYKTIMKRTNTKNLNSDQKVWLADRYLTYQYLDNLQYGDFSEIKSKLDTDIVNVSQVSNFSMLMTANKIKLKEAYDLYKKEQKFNQNINTLKNSKDEDITLKFLKSSFSYIFNISNNANQYVLSASSAMQYAFWQAVVEGGKLKNYDVSAEFLQHSLKKNAGSILITDGVIVEKIKGSNEFKEKLKEIVEKYGKNSDEFYAKPKDKLNENSVEFKNSDLYYAIHNADLEVTGKKKEQKWNLNIVLHDRYDYTDFKDIRKYYKDTEKVYKSIFSSILYNLAYVSVGLGVIKEYDIYIKFSIDDYEVGE